MTFIAALALLVAQTGLFGQGLGRQNANRPASNNSPSSALERNFGRIGGSLGSGSYNPYTLSGVGTPMPMPATGGGIGNHSRRYRAYPGQAYAMTYGGMSGGSATLLMPGASNYSPGLSTGSMLPHRGRGRNDMLFTAMHRETLLRQQEISLRGGERLFERDYANWGHPEAGPVTAKSAADELPPTELNLDELVSNHLAARRESYLAGGWATFKEASDQFDPKADDRPTTYQDAQRLFNLADTATLDMTDDKPAIKLSIAYTCIAAAQYAEGANALGWFLNHGWDEQAQQFKEPYVRAFRQMRNFGRFYGRQSDYSDHNEALQKFAKNTTDVLAASREKFAGNQQTREAQTSLLSAQTQATEANGLVVLLDWGRENLTNATFLAGEVAKASAAAPQSIRPRLANYAYRLPKLLEQAAEPAPEPVDTPVPGLPLLPGIAPGTTPPAGDRP